MLTVHDGICPLEYAVVGAVAPSSQLKLGFKVEPPAAYLQVYPTVQILPGEEELPRLPVLEYVPLLGAALFLKLTTLFCVNWYKQLSGVGFRVQVGS